MLVLYRIICLEVKKLNLTLFLFLIASISFQLNAQERQDNGWKALFSDYSLTESKTLRLETHIRTKRFFSENDQYLIRPSVIFNINKYSSFATGVTFLSTNMPGNRLIENNIWQQFSFSLPVKRNKYFGWIRLEQRWKKRGVLPREFGSRIRFRSGFQVPLSSKINSTSPYLVIFNEVFLLIEKNFPYQYNQNWTFLGFQKKISDKLVLLSGFQRNSILKSEGFLHKNIWSSIFFYKL